MAVASRQRKRLCQRLRAAEARLLARPPVQRRAVRVTRLLPLLLIVTMLIWLAAPAGWLRALTPWVGAAALLCAGIYLGRVILRIGRFYWHHLADVTDSDPAAASLRGALYQTVFVLLGTLLLAAGFFTVSTQLLADGGSALQSRLLWALTVGGMILSLFFGELVTRLIELMEVMLDASDAESEDAS